MPTGRRSSLPVACYIVGMEQEQPPFVRWHQQCLCGEAAQLEPRAAEFLLDERIPLKDRFEVAARILCPGPETARTLH